MKRKNCENENERKEEKKICEEGEELLLGVSYYNNLENNFNVSKVSLPSCPKFWISSGM
jgi:hypothetical protein